MLSVLLATALLAHPNSVSSSRFTVDGARVVMEMRCQELTLIESLPDLDRDEDRDLVASELDRGAALVEEYFRERLVVAANAREVPGDGTRLVLRLRSIAPAKGTLAGTPPKDELVDLVFDFECEQPPVSLAIETALFRESDAFHRDHCEIAWNGAPPESRLLWVEDSRWIFRPGTDADSGVFGSYLHLGVEHILFGYDHVVFVLALVLSSRRVRSLLGVVTAFTLAHSVTLVTASMGWFDLPGSFVEPVIAISIAWVGARNLFTEPPKRLWPEAFGFGLVHGLGFAGSVSETLAAEPAKIRALLGFNLGVELGQLAIVAVLVLALRLVVCARTEVEGAQAGLAPTAVRRAASCGVVLLGLWWCAERVFEL